MPSDEVKRVIETIIDNIGLARRFIAGKADSDFEADVQAVYAVTRCLEIISEASRRLPDDLKSRHPQVPWPRIAAAGNFYRHVYQEVLASELWNTVSDQFDALSLAMQEELDD